MVIAPNTAQDVTKLLLEQLALLKEKSQNCGPMELSYISTAMAKIAELVPRV